MKLIEYLKGTGISQVFFAKKIGISNVRLNLIINKNEKPSLKTAVKIEKETNGRVSCKDFFREEKNEYIEKQDNQ